MGEDDLRQDVAKLQFDLQAARWVIKLLVEDRPDAEAFFKRAEESARDALGPMPWPDHVVEAAGKAIAQSVRALSQPISGGGSPSES